MLAELHDASLYMIEISIHIFISLSMQAEVHNAVHNIL